jgi:hypothetical protein
VLDYSTLVHTCEFGGLVHEKQRPRYILGWQHSTFQFISVSPVSAVFCDIPHSAGTPTSKSQGGINQVSMGTTEHYLFVVSIDLVGFHRGNLWRFGVVCGAPSYWK